MSDSLVCCCLCVRDIEKSYERVNLEKCKKDFDSLAEIESLDSWRSRTSTASTYADSVLGTD